jgi:RND family efflux transporter MFP subunit
MKLSTRAWGLTLLVAVSLLFMLWLADLLHFRKIAPGTVPLKAGAPAGREVVAREEEIPQDLPAVAQVISQSLVQISPQVPGRVARLLVEVGSMVRPGEVVATLSAAEFQARVRQAKSAAAQAQAQLSQVEADYRRYQRLLQEGAVSPREFEAMTARLKAARAQAAQAQAQIQEAAALEGYTVIRAPRAGVVAERPAAVGQVVQPGQPLLVLYDPRDLQVEAEINDEYRSRLRPGLTVELAVPALNYTGKVGVAEIFPLSAAASRTFKVRTERLTIPGLLPGMFARLTIPLGMAKGIYIPREAVRQIGQLSTVEVAAEGRTTSRLVHLGRSVGDKVEVLSGLQPGERLVIP